MKENAPFLEKKHPIYLTDAQMKAEFEKCEYCEHKACKQGCPADCSPADFIMAARLGTDADYLRSAQEIMSNNPLGGVCGAVCPDTHCQRECVHRNFDCYVNIPAVQATVVARAKAVKGGMIVPEAPKATGKKVAVVGSGPGGLGAAAALARMGHAVTIFERDAKPGGALRTIPDHRLPKEILDTDIAYLLKLGKIELKCGAEVAKPETLLAGFDAVVAAAGLWKPILPGAKGEELAIAGLEYLKKPRKLKGNVLVVGGGATALDCATTAKSLGADRVELLCLETVAEMPLTPRERAELLHFGIDVSTRGRLVEIRGKGKKIDGVVTEKVALPAGEKFSLRAIAPVPGSHQLRQDIDHVVISIGARCEMPTAKAAGLYFCGDGAYGPSTAVTAVATGKNVALQVDAFLKGKKAPKIAKAQKSVAPLAGFASLPVPLESDFFGRKIRSPFLLSAAPPSDGYDQMKAAYEAGWSGGIMKTSFQKGPIHIPGRYMFALTEETYANCDNVSGHLLGRVTKECRRLVKEFPDRLTMVSTGGPVTGNDAADAKGWQANTKILEDAGAMAIEYSLSCPQGGDGTEGDIVSQNAKLTAKIIDWVMQVSDPRIPKIFKLTSAVTSVAVIVKAIKEVFDRYPKKKAGITLANTFPALAFRAGDPKKGWDEGVVVGMSGEGVTWISNLALASVGNLGVTVSGNGGPMNYKAAADFLALGATTVQFCTVAMKHGYGVINELHSGLSFLMRDRGIKSVRDLIGSALPNPITGFMELTSEKMISAVRADLCEHCGNCGRCPYLAITHDENRVPVTDPAKCIGCSICVQKCFSNALYMRPRTKAEKAALKEE